MIDKEKLKNLEPDIRNIIYRSLLGVKISDTNVGLVDGVTEDLINYIYERLFDEN